MQEIFEKIIEKLEDKQYENRHTLHNDELNVGIDQAIEIVRQEAERYNNGWIPVSERLPENISTVIMQVKEIEKPTFGWYGNITGWRLSEKDFAELRDFTVVAWQPLPESYHGEGE